MTRLLWTLALAGFVVGPCTAARAAAEPAMDAARSAPHIPASSPPSPASIQPLPPPPQGSTTVIGGVVRDVDPILDILAIKVPGGGVMKIFFDQRTQAYRDGVKIPLQDLKPGDHASVETVLDGSNVFAVSVHMLSSAPSGQFQGQIVSYNPGNGKLAIRDSLSSLPVELLVTSSTSISRQGQAALARGAAGPGDLVEGALVAATFTSGQGNRGVVRSIRILALPGGEFSFQGKISYLNLARGILEITSAQNNRRYRIHFDAATMPVSGRLHVGENATITARLEGRQYLALTIRVLP